MSRSEPSPELFLYGNQHTAFELLKAWDPPVRATTRRATESATWWWDRISLPRMVRRDKLGVFLSPYFKAPGIRSCPIAITIHDLLFLRMPPEVSGRSAMYCRAFRSFAASFARRAAVVLTVSEHSRRDIIELLDVPRRKTHVVGNCVGPEYRPVENREAIEETKKVYGIKGEYALYVGNFGPHKNVDGLLRAYAALDGSLRSKFGLVLAGRADKWTPGAVETAARLGVGPSVRVTGHVAEEHLPAMYAGAAAFVTLSHWEGFGLPVLEAMACGAPVLCSNRTSLPEVTGAAALLADPDDPAACATGLERILTDDALRADLRARGIERAKRFAPNQFAKLVLDAIAAAQERA